MSIGSSIRHLSGPFEKVLCSLYRSVFINVRRCTAQIEKTIPANSRIVDIGGGDGAVLNYLLQARPDIRVTMLDLRESIGMFLDADVRDRVILHPSTSLSQFIVEAGTEAKADVLLVTDVVHHVPSAARENFMADCAALVRPGGLMIVKDIEPSGFIAWLSRMADHYITGDRHVSLLSSDEMTKLVQGHTGFEHIGSLLSRVEFPNYGLAFRKNE